MPLDRNALMTSLLVALVVGLLTAGGIWIGWPRPGTQGGREVELSRLNDIELLLRGQEKALGELKSQNANLEARLAGLEQSGSRPRSSWNLPEAYVKQVDKFFKSEAAADLLSPAAKERGQWRFSPPTFIEPQLISVIYANGVQTETMICQIEIVDYYELQFSVVWDSLEGKR